MSKYTITIKNLIDNEFDFQMSGYPIWDENYRTVLNKKILDHYYMAEIGFETAPLFRHYLNSKLAEIMPYYNTLYERQTELALHPDWSTNLTETLERNNTSTTNTESNSESQSTTNGDGKSVYLDTPQGDTYKGTMDDTNYATNVTFDKNHGTSSINDTSKGSGTSATTDQYVKNLQGNNGRRNNAETLGSLKNNLMNIDLMIINDLGELFMGIF